MQAPGASGRGLVLQDAQERKVLCKAGVEKKKKTDGARRLEYTSPAFRRQAQRRRGQHGRVRYDGEQGRGGIGRLSQFGLVKKAVVRISIDDDNWKDVWDLGQCREGSCVCRDHHGQRVGLGKGQRVGADL